MIGSARRRATARATSRISQFYYISIKAQENVRLQSAVKLSGCVIESKMWPKIDIAG